MHYLAKIFIGTAAVAALVSLVVYWILKKDLERIRRYIYKNKKNIRKVSEENGVIRGLLPSLEEEEEEEDVIKIDGPAIKMEEDDEWLLQPWNAPVTNLEEEEKSDELYDSIPSSYITHPISESDEEEEEESGYGNGCIEIVDGKVFNEESGRWVKATGRTGIKILKKMRQSLRG